VSGRPTCFFPIEDDDLPPAAPAAGGVAGFCGRCRQKHHIDATAARGHALTLLQRLEAERRVDFLDAGGSPSPGFSTDYLFGPALGQMFGVLVCRAVDGTPGLLYAFSGQYNGCWEVPGWVPPLFDLEAMERLTRDRERQIKRLGRQMAKEDGKTAAWYAMRKQRREMSRELMARIHGLYRLPNFRGERRGLVEVFGGGRQKGIPTGTGDCCAPKLLGMAAAHNLAPLSLAEFFYGRANASGSKAHGRFYLPCREKCAPILGFMLCGL